MSVYFRSPSQVLINKYGAVATSKAGRLELRRGDLVLYSCTTLKFMSRSRRKHSLSFDTRTSMLRRMGVHFVSVA